MPHKLVTLTLEVADHHALALAQFVKRVTWTEIRANAVDEDEAYVIRDSLALVREALANHGYAPR